MRFSRAAFITVLIGSIAIQPTRGEGRSIKEVRIHSTWAGLGPFRQDTVTRRPKGQATKGILQALEAALAAPPVTNLNLQNLGITPDWLAQSVDEAAQRASISPGAPNQQELFRKSFLDPSMIAAAVSDVFGNFATDDYPGVEVFVSFADGEAITLRSDSQDAFMLPWVISNSDTVSYNADLSRAIGALMPKKMANRERMLGGWLLEELARAVRRRIQSEWDLLDVENRASGVRETLEREFAVESIAINSYQSLSYGRYENGTAYEANLHATLRRPWKEDRLRIGLHLLYEDGKVHGVDDFLTGVKKYESVFMSNRWLQDTLALQPEAYAEILFVHESSLSLKALDVFRADMKACGKPELVEEVAAQRKDAVHLAIGYGADWILLPDGRMVMWRYYRDLGLLKWIPSDFSGCECPDYRSVGLKCVGAVVSTDGVLQQ